MNEAEAKKKLEDAAIGIAIKHMHTREAGGAKAIVDAAVEYAQALLAAARVPEGYVKDSEGRLIKVPPEAHRTRNGVLVFNGSKVWGMHPASFRTVSQRVVGELDTHPSPTMRLEDCYDTREAVEAAMGGK